MAAITKDVQRPYLLPAGGLTTKKVPMAGYTNHTKANKIFHGSIVCIDTSLNPGYVSVPGDVAAPATGDYFCGIAQERQEVGSDQLADGLKTVLVACNGVFAFPKASITQADMGKPCYATTDGDIQVASSNALWIGNIETVDDTYAWINIETAYMRVTSAAA